MFDPDTITDRGHNRIGDRYYQVEAVQAIGWGLLDGGRGQLRSACGTGKTLMCLRAAQLLCPSGGIVVITCPSIALIAQTLREWTGMAADHVALAVCSDDTITDTYDTAVTAQDLTSPVTTDPTIVAAWLRRRSHAAIRLIVVTHVSSHIVGEALLALDKAADLLIIDEAHRSAGRIDKHTALVHDDRRLPAKRRLSATATPKLLRNPIGPTADRRRKRRMLHMDDETVFGPVLYSYPFSRAIEDDYLDSYRLAVMGVTRAEIARYVGTLPRNATTTGMTTSLHTAMVQTALAKAARRFTLRRTLAFCNRLNEAADFARSMNRTLASLPQEMKPAGPLYAGYVNGGMTSAERQRELDKLITPPDDGWTVIANVRCLAEGVDVPAIDSVVFAHPRDSVAEIVQAIGRALRPDPGGTGVATILVPVLLPDDPDELAEDDLTDFRLLYQVVRALREQDDLFGNALNRLERVGATGERYHYDLTPLEHLHVELPEGFDGGEVLRHLSVRIVSAGRDSWWDRYAALKAYHQTFGDADVPPTYLAPGDEYPLGRWVERVRSSYRQGRLDEDRIAALAEMGFDFLPGAVEWAAGLRAATEFFTHNGHLEPVRTLKVLGVDLRAWLDRQRARAAAGELAESRRAALDALAMRWTDDLITFDDHRAALQRHHAEHGSIDLEPDPGTHEGRLGAWLVSVRMRRRRGLLTDEEIAALDAMGMRWTPTRTPSAR